MLPSSPEARISPLGENRTEFTALWCRAKSERNSTVPAPFSPIVTLHIYHNERADYTRKRRNT